MPTSFELPPHLPELRPELEIHPGGDDFSQTPTWLIYDPNNNKYYQIGYLEYQLLIRWNLDTPQALITDINKATTLNVDEKDLFIFLNFLSLNCLTKQSYAGIKKIATLSHTYENKKAINWLLKHYLFFRVPLLHPDEFLTKTLKWTRWLFGPKTVIAMALLGLIALFMVGREWEQFRSTFVGVFNTEGLFLFAITLPFCKTIHELGHAYMCKIQGLKVPMMGIAFLVMYPVFFTDTGHSWRLESKHKRLMISVAGIWMELYLAVIATWFWLFLPDGPLRSAAFFISSTSWVMSLLVNISPFMRFDGYHVLSDLLGARNLQTRSFALGRVWMRNLILGTHFPLPETLGHTQKTIFLLYAYITWVYRLIVYSGIAFLVYRMFFKALGIILFGIELYFFLLGPFVREFYAWYKLKKEITLNLHSLTSFSLFSFFLLILFLPWSSTLSIPATYGYEIEHIFSPRTAQINQVYISNGNEVKLNQVLITLYSPELEVNRMMLKQKIKVVNIAMHNSSVSQKSLVEYNTLVQKLKSLNDQYSQILQQEDELNIKSTQPGYVSELAPSLRHGLWIMKDQLFMIIVNPLHTIIEGFAPYQYHTQILRGQIGDFVPDNLSEPVFKVSITSVDYNNPVDFSVGHGSDQVGYLTEAIYPDTPSYHSSVLGGDVPVTQDLENHYDSVESQYRIEFKALSTTPQPLAIERGVIRMKIQKPSLFIRAWDHVSSILIEQSGF